jgi:hypothetical protein
MRLQGIDINVDTADEFVPKLWTSIRPKLPENLLLYIEKNHGVGALMEISESHKDKAGAN